MPSGQEHAIDAYLQSIGLDPQPNPLESAGGGDRLVDSIATEYKSISGVQNPTVESLSKAIASRAMDARLQARHVVIDTRGQRAIAERGIRRAYGADDATAERDGNGPKLDSVRVIIRDVGGVDADVFASR